MTSGTAEGGGELRAATVNNSYTEGFDRFGILEGIRDSFDVSDNYRNYTPSGEYGPNSMLPDAMSLNYEISVNSIFISANVSIGLALSGKDAAIVVGGGLQLGLQSDLAFPGFKHGLTAAVHNQMGRNSNVLAGLSGKDVGTFAGFGIGGSQTYSLKNGVIDKDGVSTTTLNIGPTFGYGQTQSNAATFQLSEFINFLSK